VQEPCDGPKMATTPSASWSQAVTEGKADGISEGAMILTSPQIQGKKKKPSKWNPQRTDNR
jgi:hypothetical protein